MSRIQQKRPPYVEAIGQFLMDLPWAERNALLDDVSAHLGDAGLAGDELGHWTERFGPPQEYARQLRTDLELGSDPESLRRARRVRLRNARPRTKLLVAVAAIACCTAIGTFAWVTRVEPLGFAGTVGAFGGRSIQAGGASELQWLWKRGGRFAVGGWIRNDAAVPVRVTAFPLPQTLHVPWDNWRVTLARDDRDFNPDHDRRFAPFTLDPGERRLIWFRGEFDRCPSNQVPGGSLGISDFDATFKLLGVTRRERIPLGFTYSVKLEHDCPPPA